MRSRSGSTTRRDASPAWSSGLCLVGGGRLGLVGGRLVLVVVSVFGGGGRNHGRRSLLHGARGAPRRRRNGPRPLRGRLRLLGRRGRRLGRRHRRERRQHHRHRGQLRRSGQRRGYRRLDAGQRRLLADVAVAEHDPDAGGQGEHHRRSGADEHAASLPPHGGGEPARVAGAARRRAHRADRGGRAPVGCGDGRGELGHRRHVGGRGVRGLTGGADAHGRGRRGSGLDRSGLPVPGRRCGGGAAHRGRRRRGRGRSPRRGRRRRRGRRLGGGCAADGRAERDVVLGVVVHGQRPPEGRRQHLAHQRDPRRPADQQDRRRSPGSTPAGSSTRRVAATVSAIAGRSMSSNSARVSRTEVRDPGQRHGIDRLGV